MELRQISCVHQTEMLDSQGKEGNPLTVNTQGLSPYVPPASGQSPTSDAKLIESQHAADVYWTMLYAGVEN